MKGWAALAIAATLAVVVQMRVDAARAQEDRHPEMLYLWSGQRVRRFAPGFETVFADLYWLRTVQYFGAQHAVAEPDFALLQPLIDITVDLDPQLEIAYRYGAIFLSEARPVGKGDPQAGVALLARGARANPGSWRLRQDLGYYTFLFLHDAHAAGAILHDASRIPGAPFWLESLAARVLAQGGDRRAARAMWGVMYEQAEPGMIKDNALYNLQRLDALDTVDAWNALLEKRRSQSGSWPPSLASVSRSGPPLNDPTGVPYAYDAASGQVSIDPKSRLWRRSPS